MDGDSSKKARPSLFESFNLQDNESPVGKASPTPLKQINWKPSNLTKTIDFNGELLGVKLLSGKSEKDCVVIDIDDDSASENSNSGRNTPALVPSVGQSVKNNTSDDHVGQKSSQKNHSQTTFPASSANDDLDGSSNHSGISFSKLRNLTQGKIDGYFQKSPPLNRGFERTPASSLTTLGDTPEASQNGKVKSSEQKTESSKSRSDKHHCHESNNSGHQKKERSHSHSSTSRRHHSEKSSKSTHEKRSSSPKQSHHRTKSTGSHSSSSHLSHGKKSEGKDLRSFNMFEVTTMGLAKRMKAGQMDPNMVTPGKKTHTASTSDEKSPKDKLQKNVERKGNHGQEKDRKNSMSHDKSSHRSATHETSSKPSKVHQSKRSDASLKTPEKESNLSKGRVKHSDGSSKTPEKSSDLSKDRVQNSDQNSKTPVKSSNQLKDRAKVSGSTYKTPEKSSNLSKECAKDTSPNNKTPEKSSGSSNERAMVSSGNSKTPNKSRHSSQSSHGSPQDEKTTSKSSSPSKNNEGYWGEKVTPKKQQDSTKKAHKSGQRPSSTATGHVVTPEMIFSQVYGSDATTPKHQSPHVTQKINSISKKVQKSGEKLHRKVPKSGLTVAKIPKKVQENQMNDYWTPKTIVPGTSVPLESPAEILGKTFYKPRKTDALPLQTETVVERTEHKGSLSSSNSKGQKKSSDDEKMSEDILNMLMKPGGEETKSSSNSKALNDPVQSDVSEQVSNKLDISNKREHNSSNVLKGNVFDALSDVLPLKHNEETYVGDTNVAAPDQLNDAGSKPGFLTAAGSLSLSEKSKLSPDTDISPVKESSEKLAVIPESTSSDLVEKITDFETCRSVDLADERAESPENSACPSISVDSISSKMPAVNESTDALVISTGSVCPTEPDVVSLGGSSVFDEAASSCTRPEDPTEMDYETYLTMISDASEKDDKSSVSCMSVRSTTSANMPNYAFFKDISHGSGDKAGNAAPSKLAIPLEKESDSWIEKDSESVRSGTPVSLSDHEGENGVLETIESAFVDKEGTEGAISIGQVILVDEDTVPFGDEEAAGGQTCDLITSFSSLKSLDDNSLHLHLSSEDSLDSVAGELHVSARVENISFPFVQAGVSPEHAVSYDDLAVSAETGAPTQSEEIQSLFITGSVVENEDEEINQGNLNCSSESVIVRCVIEGNVVQGSVEDVLCVQGAQGQLLLVSKQENELPEEDSLSLSVSGRDSTLGSVIEKEDYDAESVDDLLTEIDNVLMEGEENEEALDETSDLLGGSLVQTGPNDLSKSAESSVLEAKSDSNEQCEARASSGVESLGTLKASQDDLTVSQTKDKTPTEDNDIMSEAKLSESVQISLAGKEQSKLGVEDLVKKSVVKEGSDKSSDSDSSSEEEEITPRQTRSRSKTASDSQSEFSSPAPRTSRLRSDASKSPAPIKVISKDSSQNKKSVQTVVAIKEPSVNLSRKPVLNDQSESESSAIEKDSCKSGTEQGDVTNSASDTGEVRKSSRKRKVKSLGDDVIVFAEAGAMKSNFYAKAHEHFPSKKALDIESRSQSPSISKEKVSSKPIKANLPTTKANLVEKGKIKTKKIEKASLVKKDSSDERDPTLRSTAKEMNSPVRLRALKSPGSSPVKSPTEPRKSISFVKHVAGKENFSKKCSALDSKMLPKPGASILKKGRTLSCDDQRIKVNHSELTTDSKLSRKRNRSEEQSQKKSKTSPDLVKRGRGRPRKFENVEKVKKPVKDVKRGRPKKFDPDDESCDSESDMDKADQADDSGSDFDESSTEESDSPSESESDSSAGPKRKKTPGKYSYKKDDEYRPANVPVGFVKRGSGRPKKRMFQLSDSERDSSEEFQSNERRPLKRNLKVLSPAAKVARTLGKTDALTAAEAAVAKRKAEKEHMKNRHRNLVRKAINTQNQNQQKLKMKTSRRKNERAILVGERKRLERGAKNRVSMYYSDGMEDIRSDDSDSNSSSSSEDYLNDIYSLFGGNEAGDQSDTSSQELDSSIVQNPLNIPYYPELREAALNGEQNNNCLLVFNDDTHWNDVAEEMPSKLTTLCAKFTGAVVTSIQYQFRDDQCSVYDSDEPEAKRTRRSKKKDNTASPSSRLALRKKANHNVPKCGEKTPVSINERMLSSLDKLRKTSNELSGKSVVLKLEDIVKKKSPDKTKQPCVPLSSKVSDDSKTLLETVNSRTADTSDTSVIVINSDDSQSPKKKDLMKERKGVLGLYEEFMSMLHTEKTDNKVICLNEKQCDDNEGNDCAVESSKSKREERVVNSGQLIGLEESENSSKSQETERSLGTISQGEAEKHMEAMDCDNEPSASDINENISQRCDNVKGSKVILIRGSLEATQSQGFDAWQLRDKMSTKGSEAGSRPSKDTAKNRMSADVDMNAKYSEDRSRSGTPSENSDQNSATVNTDKDTNAIESESFRVSTVSDLDQNVDVSEDMYILVDCEDGDYVIDDDTGAVGADAASPGTEELSDEVPQLIRDIKLDHCYAASRPKKLPNQVWMRAEDFNAGVFNAAVEVQDIGPLLSFSDEVGTFVDNDARYTMDIKERIKPKQVAILADRCGFKNLRQSGDKLLKTKMSQMPTASDLDAIHNYRLPSSRS